MSEPSPESIGGGARPEGSALAEDQAPLGALPNALSEIARDISGALDRDTILARVAEYARRLCGADLASLALRAPGGAEARVVASPGQRSTDTARLVFRPGDGLAGQVLATGQTVTTEDGPADPRWPPDRAAEAEGIRAVAGVPVLAGDRVLGVLLVHRRTSRPFTPSEVATALALARHAAVAIEKASLDEAAQARATEVQVFARVHQERLQAIEQLRASQERLVTTERLRALGEMANGVAHDFNNLLAVILGRTQLIMMRTNDEGVRQGLAVIESAATDAARTVRRIQEFTRTRRSRDYVPVDLAEVIREAIEFTRGRWRDEAQIQSVSYAIGTELPEGLLVDGDAAELREVFANLLLNAFDAMPEGGPVSVTLAASPTGVLATVQDGGPGMSHEIRQRVFEPFFTTRGPQRTGLGLSVAYGIVRRHRGTIEITSERGTGTTFTVALSRSGVALPAPATPDHTSTRPSTSAARVLVVEDDTLVREVLVDLLSSAGHVPLVAADGPTGLALAEAGEPPDVALIDLGLPGMSGLEVAARLRAAHPGVPIVLVTGWADRLDPAVLERSGITRVIAKPFGTEEVLAVIPGPGGGTPRPEPPPAT